MYGGKDSSDRSAPRQRCKVTDGLSLSVGQLRTSNTSYRFALFCAKNHARRWFGHSLNIS